MNSRAAPIAVGGVAVQQRATEARDPKIKAAFEDVANAGLRSPPRWLDRLRWLVFLKEKPRRRATLGGVSAEASRSVSLSVCLQRAKPILPEAQIVVAARLRICGTMRAATKVRNRKFRKFLL
jgi:hypothetical protein